ncbi:Beta-glucanase [Sarcoptes scabiei]|uniref:Beta-glucanase n=1 Tax=Sarcoptes scabiei TaxID=52283 RepID=A0A834R8D2_SARSC|nr:Beta-glucanase [Sarcoptes scabiei]
MMLSKSSDSNPSTVERSISMITIHFAIFFTFLNDIVAFDASNQSNDWILIDHYSFDEYANKEPRKFWFNTQQWLIDDEPGNLCMGMNIFQYSCHRKENVFVNKHGHLEIVATPNRFNPKYDYGRFWFNTGKLVLQKGWLYGRFEIRAILPEGQSLRSVFLLQPNQSRYPGDWLDNGQINGLVYAQQKSAIIAGVHYKMSGGQSYIGRKLYTQRNITKSFNRYGIEWSNHSLRWLFNDFVFFEHNVTKPFDQKFRLVLQLGIGGPEFDNNRSMIRPEDAKYWPNNRFIIDYVKVFQKSSNQIDLVDNSLVTSSSQSLSSSISIETNNLIRIQGISIIFYLITNLGKFSHFSFYFLSDSILNFT